MAALRSRAPTRPAAEIAAIYGAHIGQGREVDHDTLVQLDAYVNHPDHARYTHLVDLDALLDAMKAWREGDEREAHTRFVDHIQRVNASHRGAVYAFWYHALLSAKGSDDIMRARIDVLRDFLPREAPAMLCTGIHSATALTSLKDNDTSKALEAFNAVKQCDLDALSSRARLDAEVVRALIVRQDQGSLPGSISSRMREAIDELEAKGSKETCHEAWPKPLPMDTLLSEPLVHIARQFALDDTRLQQRASFIAMNATAKRVLARAEMRDAHELLVQGEDEQAMAMLEVASETARDARAWHLVRQLEYAQTILKSVAAEQGLWQRVTQSREDAKKAGALTRGELRHVELVLALLSEQEEVQRARFEAIEESRDWLGVLCDAPIRE